MSALWALALLALATAPPGEFTWAKGDPEGVLREHVYPLGFSKDGRFGYLVEPADEACGCYLASLVIVDLKTDVVLQDAQYSSDRPKDAPFAIAGAPPTNLGAFWSAGERTFRDLLAREGIVLEVPSPAPPASLRLIVDKTEPGPAAVESYRIRGSAKKKHLAQVSFPAGKTRPLAVRLGGVIVSPFERRAAVVMIETMPGWEGPPHVERVHFVGVQPD